MNLETYLNHHLAGSEAALDLLERLGGEVEDAQAASLFQTLETEVREDQDILLDLMATANVERKALLQAVGIVSGKLAGLKLWIEGLEPGHAGLLEACEFLTLGVEGKRLLWKLLNSISTRFPAWSEVDFDRLIDRAVLQRSGLEELRIRMGGMALVAGS